ncbi:MAG TPA: L,D-transpeptidase family protein, partial [Parasegetibacter sp.]
ISNYAPVNRQYYLLQKFLEDYYRINKEESWGDTIPIPQKGYRLGDSLPEIALIKHKLRLLGDFYEPDSSHIFTDSLKVAVMRFQFRHGLTEDGVAGKQFIQQLNEPPVNRIRQILINMERLRWVPEEPETDFLLVNIPEYKLHVYEEGVHKFNMNVVVGQAQHNTVIFTGNLKYIVFSPYWNIPSGILGNEIIPAQRRNPYYLRNHNMEVVQGTTVIDPATINWSQYNGKNFPYMIRQRPGADNSLGRVKFLFPNEYNIYLHDTPAKSLFGESTRAFSHGCIRLSEPAKLAQFLLRNDSSWNEARIDSAMLSEVQKYVTLKDPVPVFIGYFTTWVDGKGKLHFRKDIYKHDEKMAEKMFTSSASL